MRNRAQGRLHCKRSAAAYIHFVTPTHPPTRSYTHSLAPAQPPSHPPGQCGRPGPEHALGPGQQPALRAVGGRPAGGRLGALNAVSRQEAGRAVRGGDGSRGAGGVVEVRGRQVLAWLVSHRLQHRLHVLSLRQLPAGAGRGRQAIRQRAHVAAGRRRRTGNAGQPRRTAGVACRRRGALLMQPPPTCPGC